MERLPNKSFPVLAMKCTFPFNLAAAFGIRSIPTLLMIPMKEEPRIMQGAMPKDQLKKAIDEFLLKQNNEAKQ